MIYFTYFSQWEFFLWISLYVVLLSWCFFLQILSILDFTIVSFLENPLKLLITMSFFFANPLKVCNAKKTLGMSLIKTIMSIPYAVVISCWWCVILMKLNWRLSNISASLNYQNDSICHHYQIADSLLLKFVNLSSFFIDSNGYFSQKKYQTYIYLYVSDFRHWIKVYSDCLYFVYL